MCSSTRHIPSTGSGPRQKSKSRSTAAFGSAGTAPLRADSELRAPSPRLGSVGALTLARGVARIVSRGDLKKEDEGILAPVWKLPVEIRRTLPRFWTQAKFFEALGSQIEFICKSSEEALEAEAGGYGDLPLVTVSSTDPGDYRLRQQETLASLSTRGRHVVASHSGHWVPLDQPELVIKIIKDMVEDIRAGASATACQTGSDPGLTRLL